MRQLYQRTRPVTGAGVSPERAPVSEVLERSEPERHDAVAGRALQVHNERDPARIVLERGVVAARHVIGPGHWRPLGGRSRPATTSVPGSDWFPAQPFGCFAVG